MKKFLILLVIPIALASCSVEQAFVKSMDKYHDAIAPDYKKYVEADTTLNEEEKKIRLNTLGDWKATIEEAKE